MKCYDDINYEAVRMDFEKCPKCNRAVCTDWAYCKHCGAKL